MVTMFVHFMKNHVVSDNTNDLCYFTGSYHGANMKMDYVPEIRFCYVSYQILGSVVPFARIIIT